MSKDLFTPGVDKGEYPLPIISSDNMCIGCTYDYLLDMSIANATYLKGKKRNPNFTYEDALRQDLREYIEMIVRETWGEFELTKKNLAKELQRRYEG